MRLLNVDVPRRALLMHAVSIASLTAAPSASIATVDPFFERLRARYILLRPGETVFEAADIVDSNPINKGDNNRGLTAKGREQVIESAKLLRELGVDPTAVFYDNGARASQTADIISRELNIPRARMEPEFRWLEGRGLGALEGTSRREAVKLISALDRQDIDNGAAPADDGTPSDSVNDVFSRMRNTVTKIEQTYGSGDFIIIPGDATVLSVLACAACGVDLREHDAFMLRPGAFYDLQSVVADYRAGRFRPMEPLVPTAEDISLGRERLRSMGPNTFATSEAGSWVLGPGVRR
jgi:broad specificity phosphatase PhoE